MQLLAQQLLSTFDEPSAAQSAGDLRFQVDVLQAARNKMRSLGSAFVDDPAAGAGTAFRTVTA